MANNFFRHFRPTYYDRHTMSMKPLLNGGISFIFSPIDKGIYAYWLYVCPEDAKFSANAAVSKLSILIQNNVKPWGIITKLDEPILSTAIRSVISENSELPTAVSHLALKFVLFNLQEQIKHGMALRKASNITGQLYEK